MAQRTLITRTRWPISVLTHIAGLLLFITFLTSCSTKSAPRDPDIISMQTIDRNGFSETVSSKDRLKNYSKVDFLAPQPYQKVLRVYPRDDQGQSVSRITSYHPNGHVWQYLEVAEGRAHGAYKEWYANGQLKIEAYVMEGLAEVSDTAQASWLFDKVSRVWDEQGRLMAEFFYEKGVLEGNSIYYHFNGSIAKVLPYKDNEIDGIATTFSIAGEVLEAVPFQKGKKEGRATGRAADGLCSYSETYTQGHLMEAIYQSNRWELLPKVENGEGFQLCFKDNALDTIVEIHQGIPLGEVRVFNEDGSMKSLYHIKEGVKEGEEIVFYPSKPSTNPLDLPSQKKLSFFWQDDSIQGKVKSWYKNGILESEREMSKNKKHGLCLAYYDNGNLMLSEDYDLDKLIQGTYFHRKEKKPISRVEQGSGLATLHYPDGRFKQKIPYEQGWPKTDSD